MENFVVALLIYEGSWNGIKGGCKVLNIQLVLPVAQTKGNLVETVEVAFVIQCLQFTLSLSS